jgi:large subunit ribosomal protein L1
MERGKKYKKITKDLDRNKIYSLQEAITEAKTHSYSSFVGSMEIHFDIKIPKDKDPKSIKGGISLPYSIDTKDTTIAVFATPDKEKDAKDAGAKYVGLENLIKDVQEGKISFDIAIASPKVMAKIAILGKELGPKGLMPNPKNGTVTDDIAKTVSEYKKGKQIFACDSSGVIHMKIGKVDTEEKKLIENVHKAVQTVEEAVGKPYPQAINKLHISPTMGPSFKVDYKRSE